jgi:hypothetical protein
MSSSSVMSTWWCRTERSSGARDGIRVEARSVAVVTLRDVRIVEWRLYHARDEALKAVAGG